jgi:hypothetical protein
MDRIFFAFPEERQKSYSSLREKIGIQRRESPNKLFYFFPRNRDCPFTLSSGKSENNNPKNPVDPVRIIKILVWPLLGDFHLQAGMVIYGMRCF